MLGTTRSPETNPNSLFAFKPRQVLLAEHNRKMAAVAAPTKKDYKISTLNPEKKQLLHQSILCYLQRNGFAKTHKRFLSEAEIQNDNWKASSLDLENIYCKYIDACHSEMHTNKEPELLAKGHGSFTTDEKMTKKKKKKGSVDNESIPIKDQSEANDKELVESVTSGKISADSEAKPNEKKRSKSTLDTPVQIEVILSDVTKKSVDDTAEPFKVDDSTKRPKDKKKKSDSISEIKDKGKTKKKKSSSIVLAEEVEHPNLSSKQEITVDNLVPDPETGVLGEKKVDTKGKKKKKEALVSLGTADGSDQGNTERTTTESEGLQPSADTTTKEKKSSKKRKRLAPDDNENQNIEVKTTEESKRRKTEGSEEGTHEDLLTKDDVLKRSKEENVQPDEHPNGKLEINGGEKSGSQNSTKKRCNGSAEPKSANAFQRVKPDEVVFAHKKLQDNSYWAKGGADVGYGAKAQEVLGQVKGRDFRHEKTKKKRGSYRGGQIDLQSHSVKFNYSDED